MKRLFLALLFLAASLATTAQDGNPVDSLQYSLVEKISDDPVTGMERHAAFDRMIWKAGDNSILVTFRVFYAKNDTIVESERMPSYRVHFRADKSRQVDPETGQETQDTTVTTISEYEFYDGVAQENELGYSFLENLIQLRDSEGKFDK